MIDVNFSPVAGCPLQNLEYVVTQICTTVGVGRKYGCFEGMLIPQFRIVLVVLKISDVKIALQFFKIVRFLLGQFFPNMSITWNIIVTRTANLFSY